MSNLQDGKLVHVLIFASRDHILQDSKLLIHLRPSPSLDDAVRRLPRNPLPSLTSRARLFLRGRFALG